MTRKQAWIHGAAGVALAAMSGPALAQASVSYGRVTNVQMVSQENARAQTGGAIVGGALGASLGSGRSAGNRAMTGLGGAFAGQQITRMATNRSEFLYLFGLLFCNSFQLFPSMLFSAKKKTFQTFIPF